MTAFLNNLIFGCLTQHRSVFLPGIGSLGTVRIPATMDEKGELTGLPSYMVLYTVDQDSNRSVIDMMVKEYGYSEEEARYIYDEWKRQTVTESGGAVICLIENTGLLKRSPEENTFTVSEILDHALNPFKTQSDREHLVPSVPTAEPVLLPETSPEPEEVNRTETTAIPETGFELGETSASIAPETGVLFASETDHSQPVVLPAGGKSDGLETNRDHSGGNTLPAGSAAKETQKPGVSDEYRDKLAKAGKEVRKWKTLTWIFLIGLLLLLAAVICFFTMNPGRQPVERNVKPLRDTLYASNDASADTLPPVATAPPTLHGYHVVGGTFVNEQNAMDQAQAFKEADLHPVVFYSARKNRHIVSLGRYDSKEEALAALNLLPVERDPEKYYWIMKFDEP